MPLSTREHISRSKTNDVSPFRKYIGRERYERLTRMYARALGGEKFEGGEEWGIRARLASLSFIARRRSIRGSKSIGLSNEVDHGTSFM